MKQRLFVLVLALWLFACAQPKPKSPPPFQCHSHIETHFHADTSFTAEEAKEIESAVTEWDSFSHFTVRFSVSFDLDIIRDRIAIYRMTSDMPLVVIEDMRASQTHGGPVHLLGWQRDNPTRVWIVVDRIPATALRKVVEHELGHAAGLNHNENGNMADPFQYQSLVDADRITCRESCLCF